ncbi:MAG TPA: RdgB/HAM1 family non-canonical purine NTP pyrophosphatase [bacterium]|jgi:XTP/dITP diphosphohydrolase|nr:RdgB/HAM1 family non-canonical purine NTP pyrophosphatase [bacterium]
MKKLVIATHNRDKFREMKKALGDLGWEIVPAFDFPGVPEVVEDGETLEENSLKKAKELSDFTGLPALSDDTGLFIDALNGQPGIFAARFAGENCTYHDNVQKVLTLMKGVKLTARKATFRTIITLYDSEKNAKQVSGEVVGTITEIIHGVDGFGYDPIFMPEGLLKTFAEMTLDEKNQISHRGRALQKARQLLVF